METIKHLTPQPANYDGPETNRINERVRLCAENVVTIVKVICVIRVIVLRKQRTIMTQQRQVVL